MLKKATNEQVKTIWLLTSINEMNSPSKSASILNSKDAIKEACESLKGKINTNVGEIEVKPKDWERKGDTHHILVM